MNEQADEQLRLMAWWVDREVDRELDVGLLVDGNWIEGTLVHGLHWFERQESVILAQEQESRFLANLLGSMAAGPANKGGADDPRSRPTANDLPSYLHVRVPWPEGWRYFRLRVECVAAWTLA